MSFVSAGLSVLVLNLGGEMIFILHQRLVANHFSPEQTVSALSELLHKLFCPELQNELWRQRELYGYHSMKRLFYKLLDSSPIKIAENSFDKLFDLMFATVKFQLFQLSDPRELLEMTRNHLQHALQLCGGTTISNEQPIQQKVLGKMSDWELQQLRIHLLSYLLRKPVKVSLLLQNNLQNGLDGSFHPCAMRSIPNALPGQVRYFDEQGKITDTQQLFHPPPIIQIRHRLRCKSSLMGMDLYDSTALKQLASSQQQLQDQLMAVTEQESSKKPLFKPVKINLHSVLLGRDDDVLNSNDFELSFDRIIGTSGVGAITAKTNTESKESLKNAAVQVLPAPQTNITVVKKSVRDRLVDNLDDENSGTAATKQLDLLSLMDS